MPTVLIIVLLAGATLSTSWSEVFLRQGDDFYLLWTVPTAQKLSGYTLGNPYREVARYVEVLDRSLVDAPADPLLVASHVFYQQTFFQRGVSPRLNNTPLLYTLWSLVPWNYAQALGMFRWAKVGLFLAGLLVLGALYRFRRDLVIILALVLLLTSLPLRRDLIVANVSTLLFAALAGLRYLMTRAPHRWPGPPGAADGVVLLSVIWLVLLKPLVSLPCALLAWHFLGTQPRRLNALCGTIALVGTLAALALPCLFFRSWSVWWDWLTSVWADNGLSYSIFAYNISLVAVISESFHVSHTSVTVGLGTVLGASWCLAELPRWRAIGRRDRTMRESVTTLLAPYRDADLLLALGIVITLALSPLCWIHYYVLLLIPGLWLIGLPSRRNIAAGLGAGALVLSAEPLRNALIALEWNQAMLLVHAVIWLPLWLGILVAIRSSGRSPAEPAA